MSSFDMEEIKRNFLRDGCAIVRGFAGKEESGLLRERVFELVSEWADPPPELGGTFRTDEGQTEAQGSEDYFISSACKVRFFWEPTAEKIRYPDNPEKTLSQLNKLGHGLHEIDAVFRKYSQSEKVKDLVRALGWKDPVLPQSMYILKNPHIGGEVTAHQDSTFLFTVPSQSCLGLWLALDDCSLENGCLWFRPGSHKEPVRRHFQRVVENGEEKMYFKQLVADSEMTPLEGKSIALNEATFRDLESRGFVPVPCKAGDLVLIHGQVEHLSLPNLSDQPRHSFQLHLVEGPNEGVQWSNLNWLQYPTGESFAKL